MIPSVHRSTDCTSKAARAHREPRNAVAFVACLALGPVNPTAWEPPACSPAPYRRRRWRRPRAPHLDAPPGPGREGQRPGRWCARSVRAPSTPRADRRTLTALAGQHAVDQLGDGRRDLGGALQERDDAIGEKLLHHLRRALGLDGSRSRQRLVEDGPDGPDVGTMIDVTLAQRLLGRHVGGSTHRRPGDREDAPVLRLVRHELGHPEVQDLDRGPPVLLAGRCCPASDRDG